MINKETVYNTALPFIKEKGRKLDYLLIRSVFENVDDEIINELLQYQNDDFGFGNALEPDVRMPQSSVVATNVAIVCLNRVRDQKKVEPIIKDIVNYFENSYDNKEERFFMVTKEVNDYPRAVWWNYEELNKNFPFGNPDPEVIGFLYKHRKYLKKLDINKLINQVVSFILSDQFLEASMHTQLSVLKFNTLVDKDIQNLIHDRLHLVIDKELKKSYGNWESYSLEPYKVYITDRHFVSDYNEMLNENLHILLHKIEELNPIINWSWYQFEDVFESIKFEWLGYLYFEIIKALRLHREI